MSSDSQKFNCKINDINSVKKSLDIVISKEDFLKSYKQVLNNTQQKIKINGFRPGKAPINMIESMYKDALIADAKEKLVRESIDSGIKANNLKVLQVTDVNFKDDTKEDGFSFSATVEVFPTPPEVPNFEGIKVEAQKDEFTQDKVDEAINQLLGYHSKLELVNDRKKPNENDTVKFNFVVSYNDGTSEESREYVRAFDKDAWNIEGSASFDSVVRDSLLNMNVGESKDCKSTIKISNSKGDFEAGDVTYKINLLEILQKVTPELTDDFVKSLPGYELSSVKELQDRMSSVIESEIQKANDERKKSAVIHKLLESYDFEIPQVMLDNEIQNVLNMQGSQYTHQIDLSKVSNETLEHIRSVYNNLAKERIQVAFLIDAISKKENIDATDDDYNDYINKISNETNVSVDKIKHDIKANNLKPSIILELIRTKTWDMLCDKANITYVEVSDEKSSSNKKASKSSSKKSASEKNEDSTKQVKKQASKKAKDDAAISNTEAKDEEEAPKKRGRKKKEEA